MDTPVVKGSQRIYLAGLNQAGRGAEASQTNPNAMVTANVVYPWMLESYHYIGNKYRTLEGIRERKETIFLDSGAFSMFTLGIDVDLEAYAEFVKVNSDIIHIASNIDAIGAGSEQKSYDNFNAIRALGANIMPVHHARDRDEWLIRYLDEGHEHLLIGGMVPEATPYLIEWLDHIFSRYLTNSDGTAKIRTHGFGVTSEPLVCRYPWHSVDSTAWNARARFGMIMLDIVGLREIDLHFSDQSSQQYKDTGWHWATLKPAEKKRVLDRLEELEALRVKDPEQEAWLEDKTGIKQGYNPDALAKMTGWRARFNIEYFNRLHDRMVQSFVAEQDTLF